MADIMIDLETMGTGPTSSIVAIGAVEMSVEHGTVRKYYSEVDLKSSVMFGGSIDPDTVMWWLRRSEQARNALQLPDDKERWMFDVKHVLMDFAQWLDETGIGIDDRRIWGNGADFDNPILSSAFIRAGHDVPWQFRNSRCYRTLKSLHPEIKSAPRHGVHHNALDDAMHQAQHWVEIMRSRQTPTAQEPAAVPTGEPASASMGHAPTLDAPATPFSHTQLTAEEAADGVPEATGSASSPPAASADNEPPASTAAAEDVYTLGLFE